jgi:hypothetical protein
LSQAAHVRLGWAVYLFCNEVKGKSMLALSRELKLTCEAAFVLCHKMREAMAEELKCKWA